MARVLIANRGEIAARIARSASEAGHHVIAVVSEADQTSLVTQLADDVVVIGPPPASASYLDQDAVLRAAADYRAEMIHPGYGFLSENSGFARRVIADGMTWVGPDPDTIDLMGDKIQAIAAARAAGVPVLAGSDGPLDDDADVVPLARTIGYPLLVKASAGGGGRGIRRVDAESELVSTIGVAKAEAHASFGDSSVYLERFIPAARHVEVQILGDGTDAVHLGDRDCSYQRRSQKVLEEAPAPGLPDRVREQIRQSSVELARACHYRGAGTVEFLYDAERETAAFIEMNTRLQVEHPVTEAITGIDLVREQLRIAGGEPLGITQEEITFTGSAIEFRINAEDPSRGFFPSPGEITRMDWPDGARADAGFGAGYTVTPFYDSLVGKLIVHGEDRDAAIAAGRRALEETVIEGIHTTIPLHQRLIDREEFATVTHSTTFIESAPDLLETL